MCNPGADTRAIELLGSDPRLGMLGSFRTRCDGHNRAADFPKIGNLVRRNEGSPDEELASVMRSLLSEACANGYEYGEHVLGPGSIMSRAACEALSAYPLYGDERFSKASLSEDHLHSIFIRAVGLESGDFACDDLPLGVWSWHLQWSPEELVWRGSRSCTAYAATAIGARTRSAPNSDDSRPSRGIHKSDQWEVGVTSGKST